MIIDTSQNNNKIIGNVKEFKTSIDPKNLEYITTLLSSNLYSNPEQSFIREIVSNAWDSHIEAGNTEMPVLIQILDDTITIRDHGVGISPQRFRDIYCNIGSSTKRESNDYIGGFGLGRYSAMACTNTAYITSYYKGTAYHYVMTKNGNSITTNLFAEIATDEKDGVEVSIKIKNTYLYIRALRTIIFFPNIYISGVPAAEKINNAKIRRFKYFSASTIPSQHKLLLGNVLYPVDTSLLNKEARDFVADIVDSGIVINFNIGEIDITPNRENIIYTSKTINIIEDRCLAAKKEINDLIKSVLPLDYDNIFDFYHRLTKFLKFDPINITIEESFDQSWYKVPDDIRISNVTYKGHNFECSYKSICALFTRELPNFRGFVGNNIFYTKSSNCHYHKRSIIAPKVLLISNSRIPEVAKTYLKSRYTGYSIIGEISEDTFIADNSKIIIPNISKEEHTLILRGLYQDLMKRVTKIDLETDPDYLKYKEANKKVITPLSNSKIILHVQFPNGFTDTHTYNSIEVAIDKIRKIKAGVIITNLKADGDFYSSIAKLKGYYYIRVKNEVTKYIESLSLTNVVDLEWLLFKDPTLSRVKTLCKYCPNSTYLAPIREVCTLSGESISNEFKALVEKHIKYIDNYTYRKIANADKIPDDPYVEYIGSKMKDYIVKYNNIRHVITNYGYYNYTLAAAVVLKTKIFRINYSAYLQIKKDELLSILCGK